MTVKNVTLQLPETLYLRLQQAANGMHQAVGQCRMAPPAVIVG